MGFDHASGRKVILVDRQAVGHSARHHVQFSSSALDGWAALRVEQVQIAGSAEHEFVVDPGDEQRIVLTTSGRRYVEARDGSRWRGAMYSRGSIGIAAPLVPTHLRWRRLDEEEAKEIHLSIPGEVLRRAADQFGPGAARPLPDALLVEDHVLEQMARALLAAARARAPQLYAESAAQFLAAHLLLAEPVELSRTEPARVGATVEFMMANLERSISLAELAEHANLSSYHFLRVFKQATGRTPFAYLRDLRVQEASRHLRQGHRSLTEIAYLCGFASHAAFSTTFKKATGVTPGDYRGAVGDS